MAAFASLFFTGAALTAGALATFLGAYCLFSTGLVLGFSDIAYLAVSDFTKLSYFFLSYLNILAMSPRIGLLGLGSFKREISDIIIFSMFKQGLHIF